uniref:Zinc finger, GRF-type n=1 Tax=Tanacetum cinerariifolium TaxID=118510 RepID=A0A6L2MN41_TANCI|nr:zinc finger, GRF-type [Tanacetum cinerariifolium]
MKAESSTPPMVSHAIKVDGDSSGEKRMSTEITIVKNDWKEDQNPCIDIQEGKIRGALNVLIAESSTPPMMSHAIKVDGDSSGEKRMSTEITVVKNNWKEVSPDHFMHIAPFNFAMVDDGIFRSGFPISHISVSRTLSRRAFGVSQRKCNSAPSFRNPQIQGTGVDGSSVVLDVVLLVGVFHRCVIEQSIFVILGLLRAKNELEKDLEEQVLLMREKDSLVKKLKKMLALSWIFVFVIFIFGGSSTLLGCLDTEFKAFILSRWLLHRSILSDDLVVVVLVDALGPELVLEFAPVESGLGAERTITGVDSGGAQEDAIGIVTMETTSASTLSF